MAEALLGVGIALISCVISITAFILSHRMAKRDSYVVTRGILTDLTTGEPAHARDLIGVLRYGDELAWKALDYSDLIKQYFVLVWALERTGHGLEGIGSTGRAVKGSMSKVITWHVRELTESLFLLRRAFDRRIEDGQSRAHLCELLNLLDLCELSNLLDPTDLGPPEHALSDEVGVVRDRVAFLKGKPIQGTPEARRDPCCHCGSHRHSPLVGLMQGRLHQR